MNLTLIGIFTIGLLGLVFGMILGYTSYRFTVDENPIIELVEQILPQSQCGQCGYPGCRPYAEAVAICNENINLCCPGGESVMYKLATLMNVNPQPVNFERKNTIRMLAIIDESSCIGCTKCIQNCPVDAIIGTSHAVHTVISDLCTGCALCINTCPTQCITMRQIMKIKDIWKPKI